MCEVVAANSPFSAGDIATFYFHVKSWDCVLKALSHCWRFGYQDLFQAWNDLRREEAENAQALWLSL